MNEEQFLDKIHNRLAEITIGNSALRNQGAPGIVTIARSYLYHEMKPRKLFSVLVTKRGFQSYLDYNTKKLAEAFPTRFYNWGGARKAVNLFIREVVYNKFLADHYSLSTDFDECNAHLENLEVPLDSHVAKGIIFRSEQKISAWTSIKRLTPEISKEYQEAALSIAKRENCARVHLDLILWRGVR